MEGRSYLKVYDDCGIGQGGIIRPVFGDVQPIPLEGVEPNIDPMTGLPVVNPNLMMMDSSLEHQDKGLYLDGSVINAGIGTPKPVGDVILYVNPETGQYSTGPK